MRLSLDTERMNLACISGQVNTLLFHVAQNGPDKLLLWCDLVFLVSGWVPVGW